MDIINLEFGMGLKTLRKNAGYSLRDVRDITGIPHNTIFLVEEGQSEAKLSTISKLGKCFGKTQMRKLMHECGL